MTQGDFPLIHLTAEPLDPTALIAAVQSPEAGAVDVFIGTVRQQTDTRAVLRLEFEAYGPMAVQEMDKIARQVRGRWPGAVVAIHHRTGTLLPGEVAVVIAVATAHRAAAFAGCRFAIDQLKETVPIWKREVFADGAVWVAAHP